MNNNQGFKVRLSSALAEGPSKPKKTRPVRFTKGIAIVGSPEQAIKLYSNSNPGARRVNTPQTALRMVNLARELNHAVKTENNTKKNTSNNNLLYNLQRTKPFGGNGKRLSNALKTKNNTNNNTSNNNLLYNLQRTNPLRGKGKRRSNALKTKNSRASSPFRRLPRLLQKR